MLARALLLTVFLAATVSPAIPQELQAPESVARTIRELLAGLEDRPIEALWDAVHRVGTVDQEVAVPVLREALESRGERARLASAVALVDVDDDDARDEAIAGLAKLADRARSNEVRVAAIHVLGEYGDIDQTVEFLQDLIERTSEPAVLIPIARTLWDLDKVPVAKDKLLELLQSRDPSVKSDAALALAEIDYLDGDVRDVLRRLRREPTPRGRLAASLLYNSTLARRFERALDSGEVIFDEADPRVLLQEKEKRIRELETKLDDVREGRGLGGGGQSFPEISEILELIRTLHVERSRLSRRDLIVAALKGMVKSLDPFSSFMDPEETRRFHTDFSGSYPGIGAQVGKPAPKAPLEILKPMYKGPAYEADILTGDQILEVDGEPTNDMELEDIVARLKGKPGSTVKLTVFRRGWDEPRTVELTRRTIEVPSVTYNMLPGGVGLVKLLQFGERSYDEFREAIFDLKQQGAEGFVIDLRNNPGGSLSAALDIVDLFVGEEELPIITQRGPDDASGERTFPKPDMLPDPLVVLINGSSASASEIVAGALKDYHRATVVGKRSFGKGSVQKLLELSPTVNDALDGEARLRLTVQYYYLPSGRCIHSIRDGDGRVIPGKEGGIEPDVVVDANTYPGWLREEFERIRTSKKVSVYVEKHFDALEDLLLGGDSGDLGKYPEFEELYRSLMEDAAEGAESRRASRDHVRQIVRFQLRRRYEDSIGKEIGGDFQDDPQLQRAVLELLEKLGVDPAKIENYAWMVEEKKSE